MSRQPVDHRTDDVRHKDCVSSGRESAPKLVQAVSSDRFPMHVLHSTEGATTITIIM
jgi:hypothetical protein